MIIASAAALNGVGSLGYIPGLKVLKIFCLFIFIFIFIFFFCCSFIRCMNVGLFIEKVPFAPQYDAEHTALVQYILGCPIHCDMVIRNGESQVLPEDLSR
ncbi:hypothetical protein BDV36DRAFT_244325 [Aspergillus pseudocaelatus]|uniref:Amino acid permease/ SLC12A domain-containing protein n=1 Tax=Aspergillus pseudocaelatus TaxID=1825620 RepID=A0ABQ6X0R5_9EURO|nr:hypothetical protein BDV36DRAFT_244325 [Aspergillus pseudocaelatus]